MSCSICSGPLNEEPDDLLLGVFSGSGGKGPSQKKRRKFSATSGGSGDGGGPSTSRGGGSGGGGGGSEEENGLYATKCGHISHRACILKWLEVKKKKKLKKCPLCQNNIFKRELRRVYLDGGREGTERRKLRGEVEELTVRLLESKKGQREMSGRIDELFEENEKLKSKVRGLKTSDIFWKSLEKSTKELEEKNRKLEERNRLLEGDKLTLNTLWKSLEKKNGELKEMNGKLEAKNKELMKSQGSEVSEVAEVTNRELKEKTQSLVNELEETKLKCVEREEKYVTLKDKVARMMEAISTLKTELEALERESEGGGRGGD